MGLRCLSGPKVVPNGPSVNQGYQGSQWCQISPSTKVPKIFKQSIDPSTPFFESLAKKSPATMDDLFRQADKYFMLKDDVQMVKVDQDRSN
ncbi:hypothetical protein AAG906_011105 [Vitis piasezkii]